MSAREGTGGYGRNRIALSLLLAFFALTLLQMGGCATYTPRSIPEAISLGYASIESVAEETAVACGHTVQGGPCSELGLITTSQKEDIKARLNQAYASLDQAGVLYDAGNAPDAQSKLDKALSILVVVRALLAESERPSQADEPIEPDPQTPGEQS